MASPPDRQAAWTGSPLDAREEALGEARTRPEFDFYAWRIQAILNVGTRWGAV